MAGGKIVHLWKDFQVGSGSAGGTALSDPIDMRSIAGYLNIMNVYHATSLASGYGSCGTTTLQILGGYSLSGTFCSLPSSILPSFGIGGTNGTATTQIKANLLTYVAPPFIRAVCICGTSAPILVTASMFILNGSEGVMQKAPRLRHVR